MMYVGVDIGTSSIKLLVLNESFEVVDLKQFDVGYRVDESSSWVIYDPVKVYEAVRSALRELASRYDQLYVGLACHSPSLVLLDREGNPLETIIWLDTRAQNEVVELARVINERELYYKTGLRASPIFFPPKLLWIKKHRPHVLERSRWVVQLKDYIFYKLTGESVTDYSMASETQLFNLIKRDYDHELLDLLGIDRDQLFDPQESTVSYRSVDMRNVHIALGGVDSVVAAAGAGVVEEGSTSLVVGSSACIDIPTKTPLLNYESGFETYFHVVPNTYVLEGSLPTAGLAFDKVVELTKSSIEDIPRELDKPSNLVLLPFLLGIRSPDWNFSVKGLVYGLSLSTSRAELLKAVLEGIAYWVREELEIARSLGINVSTIVTSGGVARSRLFNKVLADVTGVEVIQLEMTEVTGLGAALIAAVSSGIVTWRDLLKLAKRGETYTPSEYRGKYEELYKLYLELKKLLLMTIGRDIGGGVV
jgi:sugar (pentulose or hexulose) kinase